MTNHCTFKQCQALKEIGFDMEVMAYYDKRDKLCFYVEGTTNVIIGQLFGTCVSPTRSEVLQWAREKKGIHGWIEPFVNHLFNRWTYSIAMENEGWITINEGIYPTYPEAEDALIDKIIEILTPSAE